MKKILLVMLTLVTAVMFNSSATQAQILMYRNTDTTVTGQATTATITTGTTDTLYDANTLYTMYTKVGALNASTVSNYLLTFNATKIDGTGTAKVFLQGSEDGIVWRNVNSGMLGTDGYNSDTLNIAAATVAPGVNYSYSSTNGSGVLRPTLSAAVYYVNSTRWLYFRLKIIGAGTQRTIYKNCKIYTFN
jgi:hypothetical protein